jgi:hypothetical protein
MKKAILISLVFSFMICGFLTGCSEKQDAAIREKTDLGMGDMVKAKDLGIQANIRTSFGTDPVFAFYKLDCTVSHDVITLVGSVKTEEQKQRAFDLVASIDLERIKKENIINEIRVDPSLDEPPFEW